MPWEILPTPCRSLRGVSDPFGTSPQTVQASRAKRTLIVAAVLAIAVTLVLAALDIIGIWLAVAIVAFEALSTAFTVWAIGRGQRAKQDESPLSQL